MKQTYTHSEVELLLKEQHRNTRHDAIEVALKTGKSLHDSTGAYTATWVERDLMNLPQRSPLDETKAA